MTHHIIIARFDNGWYNTLSARGNTISINVQVKCSNCDFKSSNKNEIYELDTNVDGDFICPKCGFTLSYKDED